MVNCAIILAGGKGERLRPYTNDRPKVMVEVAGKPILAWQIEWLKSQGITKFVLTVSYKYEVVQEYFGDGSEFGIEIDYSIEDSPLGRGGGIKKAFNRYDKYPSGTKSPGFPSFSSLYFKMGCCKGRWPKSYNRF